MLLIKSIFLNVGFIESVVRNHEMQSIHWSLHLNWYEDNKKCRSLDSIPVFLLYANCQYLKFFRDMCFKKKLLSNIHFQLL